MATTAKKNGTSKKESVNTTKNEVVQKLAQDAIKIQPEKDKKVEQIPTPKPTVEVNLDDRINRFEKLRGLANQRERLVNTLNELTKFNYNQAESSTFSLKDANGLEFKTTNTNLIRLIANELQQTLESRKTELEKEILEFKL